MMVVRVILMFLKKSYERILLSFIITIFLFICIGWMTTFKSTDKWSSSFFSSWTIHLQDSLFIHLFRAENQAFSVIMEDTERVSVADTLFQLITSVQLDDVKTFIFKEIPGISIYERNIVVQSEQLDTHQFLSHESGPPLELILEDREANLKEEAQEEEITPNTQSKTVFLYNSHNRESFLPHLKEENPNSAYHDEVNITKVSERLRQQLEKRNIGVTVDNTDITAMLHKKGWQFYQSYEASREVVADVMKKNNQLQYFIDIHRDSLPRDKTTKTINDETYATILFVVGGDHKDYEKNLSIATTLHKKIDESYPGLSRGVITKSGPGNDGIYNQDLSENALLIELGGYENTFDELYATVDVFADAFSQFYFDTEKVMK